MYVLAPNQTVQVYPYSYKQFHIDNPGINLDQNISDDDLSEYNIFPVKITPKPEYNFHTQFIEELNPTLVDGEWVQTWQVNTLSSEMSERLKEETWIYVVEHNAFSMNSESWMAYRQELMNLRNQVGFPTFVSWPNPPF